MKRRSSVSPVPTVLAPFPAGAGSGVFINGRELTQKQLTAFEAAYRFVLVPGRYWYDVLSGAWGLDGHETAGFMLPGHDFGRVARNASRGDTGVFINGREINAIEAVRVRQALGAVYRGRWWLDGRTGDYGLEGNPMPVGNVRGAVQGRRGGRMGDDSWCSATACGNADGRSG